MIATRRGLAIACGVVVALAIALGLDVARRAPIDDHQLLPGLPVAEIHGLVWQRPGKPDVSLVYADGAWNLDPPGGQDRRVAPDRAAVAELLDTLAIARWHRRGAPTASHASVRIVAPRGQQVIGIGEPLPGSDQVWLTLDGRGVLVDRWLARVLDEAPAQLRVRTPLATPAALAAIDVRGTLDPARVRGTLDPASVPVDVTVAPGPWRLTRPDAFLLAAGPADALGQALAGISFVRFSDTPIGAAGLRLTAHDAIPGHTLELTLGGGCPGARELVAVTGSAGPGCISGEAATALERALAPFAGPRAQLIEPRPAPVEPAQLTLADGAVLDVVRGRVAGEAADPARVAELVAALAAPGTPVARPAAPRPKTLTLTPRAGAAITLELLGGDLVARAGEPLALKLAPGAIAVLARPGSGYRALRLWTEEPTTISAIELDGVRYQRGATIGDWTRSPAGPVDAAAIDALIAQLAAPQPSGELSGPFAARHTLGLTVTPPTGAPYAHALQLGAPRAGTCPVAHDHDRLRLPLAVCAAVELVAGR